MNRAKGPIAFSLVEMLVVIAVIGVLAAMLLPAISRVRASAMTAQCQSNLRQAGVATMAYAADNNMQLPCYTVWASKIAPYLSITNFSKANMKRNILICPAALQINGRNPLLGSTSTVTTSYGMNSQLDPGTGGAAGAPYTTDQLTRGVPLARLRHPATTIYIGDGRFAPAGWGWASDLNDWAMVSTAKVVSGMVHPVNQAGNYLFFDGHVAPLTATQVAATNLWNLRK